MGQPLSMDLRTRLLAAIDAGMSCRGAAARFGVAPSTAIRWQA
jgi:transposase